MSNMWNFVPASGKVRGLLTVVILTSLESKPKSGYDLLKEITEKTQGSWVPNKGTLYPVLKSLEQEGLIRVKEIGKRSKRIYELTDSGKLTLSNIRSKKAESETRVNFFKKMHLEVFGKEHMEENMSLVDLLMDVRFYVEDLPVDEKEKAIEIIRAAFEEIKRL